MKIVGKDGQKKMGKGKLPLHIYEKACKERIILL